MHRIALFYGKELAKYGFDAPHPLGRDRLDAFWKFFHEADLDKFVRIEEPVMADEEVILAFHDKVYVEYVKKASILGYGFLDYGDTPAYRGVYEAAAYVVGSTLKGLELIMKGEVDHVFNPIGGLHHARRDRAGGFCVFNDIGILIECARSIYSIERISYIDIDAHHGDGVYYEYAKDKRIAIADIHEDGRYLYPGTGFAYEDGEEEAKGTKLNIPLMPYSGDKEFVDAFKRVEEFIDNANPQLVIFQCGADGLKSDPLTHLTYSEEAHRYASSILHKIAHKHANGRMIALGGGGYNRLNIAKGWSEVIKGMLE